MLTCALLVFDALLPRATRFLRRLCLIVIGWWYSPQWEPVCLTSTWILVAREKSLSAIHPADRQVHNLQPGVVNLMLTHRNNPSETMADLTVSLLTACAQRIVERAAHVKYGQQLRQCASHTFTSCGLCVQSPFSKSTPSPLQENPQLYCGDCWAGARWRRRCSPHAGFQLQAALLRSPREGTPGRCCAVCDVCRSACSGVYSVLWIDCVTSCSCAL